MPPLQKILARLGELAQGKYAANKEALGALGRVFTESADTNPNYFAVPGRVPEADLAKLSAKHGVAAQRSPHPYQGVRAGNLEALNRQTVADYIKEDFNLGNPSGYRTTGEAVKRGQLNPGTDLYNIDAMLAAKGSGEAKKAYPLLYEWLLAQPDAGNMAFSGLSLGNMTRRNLAMSGAVEKYGARAGDRLRIHNDQIAPVGDAPREASYHRLSAPEKVGLLNAITAPNTVDQVNTTLESLVNQSRAGAGAQGSVDNLMKEARSLGVHEGVWTPSTDVGADYFPRLTELLGAADMWSARTAGVDSLRRAAITYDAAGGGLTAADMAAQPYLTTRIARKTGGSVPGPLSQAYACEVGG